MKKYIIGLITGLIIAGVIGVRPVITILKSSLYE